MLRRLPILCSLAACLLPAFAAEWLVDWEEASARAAAEKKAVLVDFTGSDWCQACILLRRQVLDTPAFGAYAADKFVLMEVDVPKKSTLSAEQLRRNRDFCAKYHIEAFPTLLVLTPGGTVLGGMVASRSSVAEVAAPLDEALANAERLRQAEAMQGSARVKALYAIYSSMPKEIRRASGLRERIAELDAEGVTPLPAELAAERQMKAFHHRMKEAGRDMVQQRRVVEETLASALPANRRSLLEMRYQLLLWTAEGESDVLEAKATMLALLDPDSPDAAARRRELEARFADPAAVLQQLQEMRRARKTH